MTKLQIDRCAFLTSIIQFYKQIKLALERVQQSLICFLLCANATCVLHLVVLLFAEIISKTYGKFCGQVSGY